MQDQTEDDAQRLAHKCARNDPDADDKVNRILIGINLDMNKDPAFVRGLAKPKSSHKSIAA